MRNLNLLGFYVTDLSKTLLFYQQLGFELVTNEQDVSRDVAYVHLGEFKLQFIAKASAVDKPENFRKEALGEPKGTGLYINIQVDHIDELYHELVVQGVKTSSEPKDWPWGNREFALRDPDGYKLVLYQLIASKSTI